MEEEKRHIPGRALPAIKLSDLAEQARQLADKGEKRLGKGDESVWDIRKAIQVYLASQHNYRLAALVEEMYFNLSTGDFNLGPEVEIIAVASRETFAKYNPSQKPHQAFTAIHGELKKGFETLLFAGQKLSGSKFVW